MYTKNLSRLTAAAFIVVMLAGIMPIIAFADENTPIVFADAALENAIKNRMGKSPADPITQGEALELRILDIRSRNIWSLEGLQYFTNLIYLELYNNNITDISALAALTKLKYLWLSNNNITDISPLAALTELQELVLRGNNPTDISSLAGLTKLRYLYLENNNINDISALAGLTELQSLSLDNNNIADISALAALTELQYLELNNNSINDISALAALTELQYLGLDNNNITDISVLAGFTGLQDLRLNNNNITDISALAGLTELQFLGLYNNNLTNISALKSLVNLYYLNLEYNRLNLKDPSTIEVLDFLGDCVNYHLYYERQKGTIYVNFYDDYWNKITSFGYSQGIWVEIEGFMPEWEGKEATFIIGMYDTNGNLLGDLKILSDEDDFYYYKWNEKWYYIDFDGVEGEVDKVKVMVWDDPDLMIPLCDFTEIYNGGEIAYK